MWLNMMIRVGCEPRGSHSFKSVQKPSSHDHMYTEGVNSCIQEGGPSL